MTIAVRGRGHDRRQTQKRRKERKGKMKGRWFSKRIDVPEEPIRIHFQRPEEPYQDPYNPEDHYYWKKGAKHYIKKFNKFLECALDECLTCAYHRPNDFGFDASLAQRFLEKNYPNEYYSLNCFVEEWHVIVERERKSPGPNGETTYPERVLEKAAIRELKEEGYDPRELDLPRVFGFQGFIDLSAPAWHNDFAAVYEQVERFTKDGGYLLPMFYGCSECGAEHFPVAASCESCGSENCGVHQDDNGGITHKMFCGDCEYEWDLLESESKPLRDKAESLYVCSECGHKDYPRPFFAKLDLEGGELHMEEPEEGWDRYDIFDVQITIRKQRSNDKAPPRTVIDSWRFAELDPRHFDPEYQGGKNDEQAKKIAERNAKAIPLDDVHAMDGPEEQAKVLKLSNLFGTNKAVRGPGRAVRYSRGTKDEGEETEGEESEE